MLRHYGSTSVPKPREKIGANTYAKPLKLKHQKRHGGTSGNTEYHRKRSRRGKDKMDVKTNEHQSGLNKKSSSTTTLTELCNARSEQIYRVQTEILRESSAGSAGSRSADSAESRSAGSAGTTSGVGSRSGSGGSDGSGGYCLDIERGGGRSGSGGHSLDVAKIGSEGIRSQRELETTKGRTNEKGLKGVDKGHPRTEEERKELEKRRHERRLTSAVGWSSDEMLPPPDEGRDETEIEEEVTRLMEVIGGKLDQENVAIASSRPSDAGGNVIGANSRVSYANVVTQNGVHVDQYGGKATAQARPPTPPKTSCRRPTSSSRAPQRPEPLLTRSDSKSAQSCAAASQRGVNGLSDVIKQAHGANRPASAALSRTASGNKRRFPSKANSVTRQTSKGLEKKGIRSKAPSSAKRENRENGETDEQSGK